MARRKDKEKAIALRLEGKSYNQIKKGLDVSKSTLSYWLRDYPLSAKQLRQLRDVNPRRIENFRNTFRKKREHRLSTASQKIAGDVGSLTKRERFVAGLFLYWAEGTKVLNTATSVANTDPAMLRFVIKWFEDLGVEKKRLRARLHLYADMNEQKEKRFWAKALGLSISQFGKSYVKSTKLSEVKYNKGGHGHGTCNIIFGNRDLNDYVIMGIKYLQDTHR